MSERHPFYDTNPKHLDCGELIDAETGESLREATAEEASRSMRAQRHEGAFQGVIATEHCGEPVLAWVRVPQSMAPPDRLSDWRLAVALKLKWERSIMRRIRERERLDRKSDDKQ